MELNQKKLSTNIFQDLQMRSQFVNVNRDTKNFENLVDLHSHSFYEIIYCERGDIVYMVGTRRYNITDGDIILIPPGTTHCPISYNNPDIPYERIVLWVSYEVVKSLMHFWNREVPLNEEGKRYYILHTKDTDYSYLKTFFENSYLEETQKKLNWETCVLGNTISFLSLFSRIIRTDSASGSKVKHDLIDRIVTYVEEHFTEKLTLTEVATHFHISESQLGKLFRKHLNSGFHHHLTLQRLNHAKQMILEGYSLEQTAISSGFTDYSVFYRSFKNEFQCSPKEYFKLIHENTRELVEKF